MQDQSRKNPTAVDIQIGAQVRMRRLIAGLSQVKLAEALGISYQQLQKYECGGNRISAGRLRQIAAIFGVEPGFFFAESEPDADVAFSTVPSTESLTLLRAFLRITDPMARRRVIQLVTAMAEAEKAGQAMADRQQAAE